MRRRELLRTIRVCAAVATLGAGALGCVHHHRSAQPELPPGMPPAAPAEADRMATRDLGPVAADACDVAALVSEVGPRCRRVIGQAATGSEPATSASAFDGNACTTWSGGGAAPKFVAVDFGKLATVTGVLLIAEVPAVGAMKHVVESSDDGTSWKVAYVVEGQMAGSRAYSIPFRAAFTARYLRITTETSSGPVAWREIVPVDCS